MVHSCPDARARQACLSLLALKLGVGMVAISTGIAAQLRLPDDPDGVGRGAMRDPRGNARVFYDYATGDSPDPTRCDRNLEPLDTDYDLYVRAKDGASHEQPSHRSSDDDVILGLHGSFLGLGKGF